MGAEPDRFRLPPVLVTSDGRDHIRPPANLDAGLLVRDTDLAALVHLVGSERPPDVLDIDSVAGLGGDDLAVDFVTERLGIRVVMTRRPQLAARAAERGHLGLIHVFAYDSTGMARSLESHARSANLGSVLSPGLVIVHLRPDEVARMPSPVVAYGFIDSVEDALSCSRLADAIVLRPAVAARLAKVSEGA